MLQLLVGQTLNGVIVGTLYGIIALGVTLTFGITGIVNFALGEFMISGGLTTNLSFHRWIVRHPEFIAGNFDTGFIGREYHPAGSPKADGDDARTAAILLAAIATQQNANHTNGQPAAPSRAGTSAWKTLGRIDMLRR